MSDLNADTSPVTDDHAWASHYTARRAAILAAWAALSKVEARTTPPDNHSRGDIHEL